MCRISAVQFSPLLTIAPGFLQEREVAIFIMNSATGVEVTSLSGTFALEIHQVLQLVSVFGVCDSLTVQTVPLHCVV